MTHCRLWSIFLLLVHFSCDHAKLNIVDSLKDGTEFSFDQKSFYTQSQIPPSTISCNKRKLLGKQAPESKKRFFSPIIFLLLDTFTQYNFKMPTSYFLPCASAWNFFYSSFHCFIFLFNSRWKPKDSLPLAWFLDWNMLISRNLRLKKLSATCSISTMT